MIDEVRLSNAKNKFILENNHETQKTTLGVDSYAIMFQSKQEVVDHIALLNDVMSHWVYE